MRVDMVSEHASPLAAIGGTDAGGQNVHVAALAEHLGRSGVEVVVHTRRDDAALPSRVQMAPGVTVHHVDAGPPEPVAKDDLYEFMPEFGRRLAVSWRRRRPDLVHSHFWMSAYAALPAAEANGIPLVHTFHALGVVKRRHQGYKDTSPPERLATERDIVARASHIVATCTDEVFELMRLGAAGGRLTVVPCGVDLDRFTPHGPSEPGAAGLQRIVAVTRLVERKGVGNLITALADLPGVELVVAGGPERGELDRDPGATRLRELAREVGVADRLVLRGRVPREELPALLRSADAVVCNPWYEPFGIVPLEAMACGTPVVASAVGGLIDTVVDDRTGVHVPPRDPDRLVEAIGPLLGDPARREQQGAAGVERARRLYGWGRVSSSTLDVYRRVLAHRRTRRPGPPPAASGLRRLESLRAGLGELESQAGRIDDWGRRLAAILARGGRLLAAGNGGSAAEAQHMTAELVGRFEDERRPLSALCLHGDTSSLTAITNDYGNDQGFARQVRAHGRPGDVLLALSTSGTSPNVVAAAEAARETGMEAWALTGEGPNPLAQAATDCISLPAASSSTVQELHLVAVHLLCGAVDQAIARDEGPAAAVDPHPQMARLLEVGR